jgi:hypothetical protein
VFLVLFLFTDLAHAQLSRLDSLVGDRVQEIAMNATDVTVTLDSSLASLRGFLPPQSARQRLEIEGIEAILDTSTRPALLSMSIWGRTGPGASESRRWTNENKVSLDAADTRAIETNSLQFVKIKGESERSSSIWSDLIEPVLVVIAAGAIVALFFLIRS